MYREHYVKDAHHHVDALDQGSQNAIVYVIIIYY